MITGAQRKEAFGYFLCEGYEKTHWNDWHDRNNRHDRNDPNTWFIETHEMKETIRKDANAILHQTNHTHDTNQAYHTL